MEFHELSQRALEIRQKYALMEQKRYSAAWTNEELALGFVGDVGDLAKLVVAMEGKRDIPDARSKLAHELADCLWSVIALAEAYQINLEKAFLETMTELDTHITHVLQNERKHQT
jgi:NTP pyrophosphatase (non-canonical NTP hydrolase)